MKTNLLLLAIILGGGWYLFHMSAPAPAVRQVAAPVQPVTSSNARTYYSPLDDPAVSASRGSGIHNPASRGLGGTSQTGLSLGGTTTASSGGSAPSTSFWPGPVRATGDGSNLNVSKRADDIARAAKGE